MHDPLDEFLRETLEGAETAPAPDTWEQIRRGIGKNPRPPYRLLILTLLILGSAIALYRFYPIQSETKQYVPVVMQDNKQQPPAPPSPSMKKDSMQPGPVTISSTDPVVFVPVIQPLTQKPRENLLNKNSNEPVSLTIPIFLPDGTPEEKLTEPELPQPETIPAETQKIPQPETTLAPKGNEPQSGRKSPGILGIIAKGADVVMGDLIDYNKKEKTNGYNLKINLFGKKINISKN